jgi:hypothetical protein
MAFSFTDENPVLGNATVIDDSVVGRAKPITEEVIMVSGLVAASTSLDVLVAPYPIQVTGVSATFGTASSSGTADLVKMTGTTAVASGTTLLTGTISLAGTANTPVNGTLITTISTLQLAKGDRLGVKLGGTLTSLVNCNVSIRFTKL